MQLREYQIDAINALWSCFREHPTARPLVVCPTGSGKSHICAEIIKQIRAKKKDWRVLVLTHRKEIVEQNSRKYQELTGEAVGIMSAGLGLKIIRPVTFANIQSIYRDTNHWDVVIIDECHLISGKPESMYAKFLDKHSSAKVIGLTATPYRMDHGFLIGPNTLFTHVAYEIHIAHLIGQGFLSPLVTVGEQEMDTSKVAFRGFDFAQEQLEVVALEYTKQHAESILKRTENKRHVLVFCAGVNHAQEIAALLGGECVHGGLANFERDRIIERFKSGINRYLTNCDILTTGFDFPAIDCIVLLRATQSTGLYVQICGRGSRIAEGKKDCLILDYGGNVRRHGPIDLITVEHKERDARFSLPPLKTCSECGCVVNIRVMECPCCRAKFPELPKHTAEPIAPPILAQSGFNVEQVNMCVHFKVGGTPSFRIDYFLDFDEKISDFWCFGHTGYAREKACQNWQKFGGRLPAPRDAHEAFDRKSELRQPTRIVAKKDGKYWRVTKILEWYQMQGFDDDPTGLNI